MNYNKLNSEEERVIVDKATEPPFIGEYDNFLQRWNIYLIRTSKVIQSSN
jgi:peptide methionine sulfoxide reductase MsrB